MLRIFLSILLMVFYSTSWASAELARRHAICYEHCNGRFGDKILLYAQARYLSYSTGVTFLHAPFENSQHLVIDYDALPYHDLRSHYQSVLKVNSEITLREFYHRILDPNSPSTLFMLEYFAEDLSEWDNLPWTLAFDIPWKEEGFLAYLKQACRPSTSIPNFRVQDRLNVADHVRTLSGGDRSETSILTFPLKHPNLDYHERQIRRVYEWNKRRPMHVFLFSDTSLPADLIAEFRKRFVNEDIIFGIQELDEPDVNYVVQDFFAMQEFDVLITTRSNLSSMASHLGDFDLIITPLHASGSYPNWVIDRVRVMSKKSEWFPFDMDLILREESP
ncbi:MAG: hypothetical protein JSS61_03805 [Verrucomicrobia bacterium]|nr:hypothetical protein [Verrucomicrobiota bacterium]